MSDTAFKFKAAAAVVSLAWLRPGGCSRTCDPNSRFGKTVQWMEHRRDIKFD